MPLGSGKPVDHIVFAVDVGVVGAAGAAGVGAVGAAMSVGVVAAPGVVGNSVGVVGATGALVTGVEPGVTGPVEVVGVVVPAPVASVQGLVPPKAELFKGSCPLAPNWAVYT